MQVTNTFVTSKKQGLDDPFYLELALFLREWKHYRNGTKRQNWGLLAIIANKQDYCNKLLLRRTSQLKHSFNSTQKSSQNILLPVQFAGIISEVREIMNIPLIPWLRY